VFEDHVPVRELLSEKGEGQVLVVDGDGSLRIGIVGDKMAAKAVANGWVGLIVFGAIRDSADISQLALGVMALGTTARRAWTDTRGARDVPVTIGGACFESGNWVYADRDAVLVSPKELTVGSR
jgi:regulator of ribonuclease activity A